MPSLADHQSSKITKLLLQGDSGSGKTSALASLALAGYKLHILDFDNGLDPLVQLIKRRDPKALANVDFKSFRDKIKGQSPQGVIFDGIPSAFSDAIKSLDKWEDGSKLGELGPEHVVVIDTLTFMSDAAFNWATSLNPGAKDKRQIFGHAQQAVEAMISQITSSNFKTNVIVIAHMKYMDRPDGTTKAYPTSVGAALSPKIPAYFNSVLMCETVGSGSTGKRQIRTQSTAMVDLKNSASFDTPSSFPTETGLADFFKIARGG